MSTRPSTKVLFSLCCNHLTTGSQGRCQVTKLKSNGVVLSAAFLFFMVGCDLVPTNVTPPSTTIVTGACWLAGEPFRHVLDKSGGQIPVEQVYVKLGVAMNLLPNEFMGCGVHRTAAQPFTVPHPLSDKSKTQGFLTPLGKGVAASDLFDQRYWILEPAQWHEN